MRASSRLHRLLFSTVMRAPMSFFDHTPRGRIVNRFSRDMDESTSTHAYTSFEQQSPGKMGLAGSL